MARIKKTDTDEKKPVEGKDKEKNPPSPLRQRSGLRKGKKEYSGSRWAALILLILTIVAGLWFYIDGLGGWQGLATKVSETFSGIGWEKTYTFGEKN